MSRLTVCIALLAASLVAVGCGGSSSKSSNSSDQSKPTVAATPGGGATAQAAAPTSTATKKAKAKAQAATAAAAKGAGAPAGSPKAHATVQQQVARVKTASKVQKQVFSALSGSKPTPREVQLAKLESKGKATKAQAKELKAMTDARAKQIQKHLHFPKTPTKVPGKVGLSKIPARVATACQRNLRPVDGALGSSTKASKLPSALSRTIAQLKILGSVNSPAATGVTGDYSGMSRAQETMAAMQRVLAPAKAYSKSPSSANAAKLKQALKGLNNTAKVDELNACAIA